MTRRIGLLVAGILGLLLFSAAPAAAHDCSSDGDCEQTGGYNGAIAVVGGAAAVAAVAAAAVARTPKDKETDLAILQLDANEFDIDSETPAVVTLTGWHVGNDGNAVRVPMTIWISGAGGSGVTVVPDQGEGTLVATISVDAANPSDADEITLTAHGVWKGNEATETITIRLGGDLELRIF